VESSVVLVNWIRSKVSKPEEPAGKSCIGCLKHIPGATDEELFFAGGVLLAGAGWFCGARCENQYRLRFRVQSSRTTSGETTGAVPHSSRPSGELPVAETKSPAEPLEPERAPAADVLAEALRARRRRMNSGG
jgi:hypothetical protein